MKMEKHLLNLQDASQERDKCCEICHTNSWTVLMSNNGPSVCSGGEVVQNNTPLVKLLCSNCGFIYTFQSPLDEDIDSYYKSKYSTKLEDKDSDYYNYATNATFGQTLNNFVLSYPYPPLGKLLDIGCGKGFFEKAFLEQYPRWQIEGVDPSIRSIELAKQNAPGAKFYLKKFHASDYVREIYDFVAIHTVLNRVPPRTFLSDAVSLLKHGAIMSISIVLFPQAPFQLFFADHHYIYFKEHLMALTAQNGLEIIKVDYRGSISRFLFKKSSSKWKGNDTGTFPVDVIKEHSFAIVDKWKKLFDRVNVLKQEGRKLAFYGAGTAMMILLAQTAFPEDQIMGIYDDTPSKIGKIMWGKQVQKLDDRIKKAEAVLLCSNMEGIEIMKAKIKGYDNFIHL